MTNPLHTPVCDLLGCRQPIVLAGMGGVARSELVAAVTAAGGFGFLGMVREPPGLIRREILELRRLGHERFGVNLIPAATDPKLLAAELATVIELKVPVVCLFWDIDEAVMCRLRDAGILVVYQVGSVAEGVAAAKAGAAILIAQGVEAGGHVRGTRPLHQLLPELIAAVSVPVLAAGGIADGDDVVAALALGAQGVVLGTVMITTRESFAHDFHKERLLAASADDTVLTEAFHVNWPAHASVRVLASEVTNGRRGDPATAERTVIGWEDGRPIYLFSTDSPLRSMTGNFADMALYAGMGVGKIHKMVPAGTRIASIVSDAEALLSLETPAGGMAEASSPACYAGKVDPQYMGYLDPAGLAEKLTTLHVLCRTALALAGNSPGASRYARWTVLLARHIEALGGPSAKNPPRTAPADLPAADAALADGARALLPQIGDDRVRGLLLALVADFAGAASPVAPPLQLWHPGGLRSGR